MGPFVLFSPAVALDLFVIVLLLVAAHGAYALARRFGADRTGAVLAGVAFAGSGYIACQLKHLAIVSTVVWFPVGLLLLDKTLAASPTSTARRTFYMGAFGLVVAEQALCGFPQSIYICAIGYGAFVLFRAVGHRHALGPLSRWCMLLGGIAVVTALGAAAGAIVLLPLSKLGTISDRAEALGWIWSTLLAYWPPNILTFFVPYIHGDIANNTYTGPPFFWEDYGYVGLATALLAIYEGVRGWRRPVTAFTAGMTVLGYLFVLGAATPVFHVAYLVIPGMKMFRFPTRFLFVVELGLALLAALGLTRLRGDLTRRLTRTSGRPCCRLHTHPRRRCHCDLRAHGRRPWDPSATTESDGAGARLARTAGECRHRQRRWNRTANLHAMGAIAPSTDVPGSCSGWANLQPYFELRDVLQPNIGGGFWGVPSADCYAGISARWYVDVWGDHNREAAVVPRMAFLDFKAQTLKFHPTIFPRVMSIFGVTHLLSPYPQNSAALPLAGRTDHAYVYRVPNTARVRFVSAARAVANENEALNRLVADDFDPDREVVVHDVSDATLHPTVAEAAANSERRNRDAPPSRTRKRRSSSSMPTRRTTDSCSLPTPTTRAGSQRSTAGPAPIYRANLMLRAVPRATRASHRPLRLRSAGADHGSANHHAVGVAADPVAGRSGLCRSPFRPARSSLQPECG